MRRDLESRLQTFIQQGNLGRGDIDGWMSNNVAAEFFKNLRPHFQQAMETAVSGIADKFDAASGGLGNVGVSKQIMANVFMNML